MLSPEQIALIEQCGSDEHSRSLLRNLFLEQEQHYEEALQEQERLYQTIVEQQSDLICRCQPDGTLTFANTALSHFVQQPAEALRGQNVVNLLCGEGKPETVAEQLQSCLAHPEAVTRQDHWLHRADGVPRWIQWAWQPIHNGDHQVVEIQILGRDNTELKESDEALQGSIAQYHHLIDASPDGILITIGSVVYYSNPVMADMLGAQSAEQLVGKTVFDLLHSSQHQAIQDRIESHGHDNEYVRQRREQFVRFDGRTIDVEVSISNIEIDNAPATMTFVRDISERMQTERNLEHFRSQLIGLQRLSIDLAKIESLDDLCRQAVERGRQQLGFDRFSLWLISPEQDRMHGTFGTDDQGQTIDERHVQFPLTHANISDQMNKAQPVTLTRHQKLLDTDQNVVGEGWNAQGALFRGDEIIGVFFADNLMSQKPVSQQQLEMLSLYSLTLSHLVSRLRVAEARQQSDARYRAVFENTRFGISITNAEGKSVSMNPRMCEMLGYDADTLRRMNFTEYTHPEDREINLKLFNEVLCGERNHYQIVQRFVRQDGSSFPARLTVAPFPPENEGEMLVLAMIEDIADQMKAQMLLLESEARHRALLEAVPDMYFRLDAEGIYQDCHAPDPDMLFMAPEEQVGKHYREVMPPALAELMDTYFRLALKTSETQTFDAPVEFNGTMRHFEYRIVAYDSNQVLVVVRDMTERVEAMQQLRESEERFRQFASNIDEMIYLIDVQNDQVLYMNEAYERLWQQSRRDLYEDIRSYIRAVHPDDRYIARSVSLHNPDGTDIEYRIVLPDGQDPLDVEPEFPHL